MAADLNPVAVLAAAKSYSGSDLNQLAQLALPREPNKAPIISGIYLKS